MSSAYFAPLAELLGVHGRVFVFDLPGFGGIPHPSDPMTIADFAAAVRGALPALGVDRPVFVGHSMGAQVVVELAADPVLGGASVLVSPVVAVEQRQRIAVLAAFLRSARHERLPAALRSVRGYLRAAPRWVVEVFPSMIDYPIEQRIGAVWGEAVIVHGDLDRLCPASWVAQLAQAARHARVDVVTLPSASHQVVVDHAAEVAQVALTVAGIGSDLP